jgi:ABC-type sugar transport system substrate-binding protein
VLILVFVSGSAQAEPVARVGLLVAGEADHPFWGKTVHFAEAVAEDLDIDLEVSFSAENSYSIKHNGLDLLDELDEGDYFLSGYFRSVTAGFLEKAEEAGINTIVFNTDVLEADKAAVGRPREKYTHWLAHLVPDEAKAGRELGAALIDQARRAGGDIEPPLEMMALTGPLSGASYDGALPDMRSLLIDDPAEAGREDSPVSLQRIHGLESGVAGIEDVDMLGFADAYWLPDQARDLTSRALERFDVDVIWSASDAMALAALDAVREVGLTPGRDIVVGGFDWTEAGLQAVTDGHMAASMGGHFMEAGWALVLIHDHARGEDFAETAGVNIVTRMSAITPANVERYREHFGDGQWGQVDFRRFSRVHNDSRTEYNFSPETLFEQVP